MQDAFVMSPDKIIDLKNYLEGLSFSRLFKLVLIRLRFIRKLSVRMGVESLCLIKGSISSVIIL